MIDLHTHTNESDGSYTPAQLIQETAESGLEALAITDHDTLAGYDAAVPLARDKGLELICGIELSTKFRRKSVHLLGYFIGRQPSPEFRGWLKLMQDSRRDRNIRLIARLRSLGFDMTLEEAEARGRGMTGRPHFAKIMVEKGYVANRQEAFDRYLDESAIAYVDRLEPQLEEGIRRIADGGGLTILPHPVRVGDHARMRELLPEMQAMGLDGVEIYHPDHSDADTEFYVGMARQLGMAVSGGSDFHGELKPGIRLGLGNMPVPSSVLDDLRKAMPPRPDGHPC